MSVTTRHHLLLIAVLLGSLLIIGTTSYVVLHRHAKAEVIKQAAILMEAALAMRKYTINEIKPLLALQNKRKFLPQSVPSYAATKNFDALRESNSDYRYKEATLNPTNPRDRATDWETDIIQEFRNSADTQNLTLVRDTPLGAVLYYARPIRIKNQGCLTCHGMVEDAPQTMISLYGPANGFGWKMNEVIGSQIVSVPLSLPVARANNTFWLLMSVVVVVFAGIYLLAIFAYRRLASDAHVMTLTQAIPATSSEQNKAQTDVELDESEEEDMSDEASVSLGKLYQKHQMGAAQKEQIDALLAEGDFDLVEALTQPGSDDMLPSESEFERSARARTQKQQDAKPNDGDTTSPDTVASVNEK